VGSWEIFGEESMWVLSSMVSGGMPMKKLMDEVDSVVLVRMVMDMQEPDLEVVAMIAWSEEKEAGMMESVVGERGGKSRLDGDMANIRSMQLVSQAWRTI
jgi:hypothetical protein